MIKHPLYRLAVGALLLAGCAHQHAPRATLLVEGDSPVASSTAPSQARVPAVSLAPDLSTNPPSLRPAIHASLPSLFLAGDSTAARGSGTNQQGWAVPFAEYFDPDKINIINRARGGRSSRTFFTEGLLDQLLADVKSHDFVLIQFGHNDGGPINDECRARGSLYLFRKSYSAIRLNGDQGCPSRFRRFLRDLGSRVKERLSGRKNPSAVVRHWHTPVRWSHTSHGSEAGVRSRP